MINHVSAGLIRRGLAYSIDCVVAFCFFAATQLLIFVPLRQLVGITQDWFRSGLNTELYTLITISPFIWWYFTFFESSAWQAGLGKRVLELKVVDASGISRFGFGRSLLRTAIKLLPWEIAHLTNNLPEPLWYAEDAAFRLGFAIVGALMGLYVLSVALSRKHQAPHDLIAQTIVINRTIRPREKGDEQGNSWTHNRVGAGQHGLSQFHRPPRIIESRLLGTFSSIAKALSRIQKSGNAGTVRHADVRKCDTDRGFLPLTRVQIRHRRKPKKRRQVLIKRLFRLIAMLFEYDRVALMNPFPHQMRPCERQRQ